MIQCSGDSLRRVDFAFLQPFSEIFRGNVHIHYFVCFGENCVRQTFSHLDANRFLYGVIETFQVLHIQGGNDMNACGEYILHVLIAFRVSASRGVGVSQFIN